MAVIARPAMRRTCRGETRPLLWRKTRTESAAGSAGYSVTGIHRPGGSSRGGSAEAVCRQRRRGATGAGRSGDAGGGWAGARRSDDHPRSGGARPLHVRLHRGRDHPPATARALGPVLQKPFSPWQLAQSVREALDLPSAAGLGSSCRCIGDVGRCTGELWRFGGRRSVTSVPQSGPSPAIGLVHQVLIVPLTASPLTAHLF